MKPAKQQYPYIDDNGNEHYDKIRHFSENGYTILQVETGIEYGEAVDVIPCRYTYVETDKPIEKVEEEVEE